MEKSSRYPSYTTCVARALSASPQPLSIEALLATVSHQRPTGKGARRAIYQAIRNLYQAIPVAPSQIGWLSHLLQNSTFRHPLTAEEVRRGYLLLDELEHAVFFPQFFQNHRNDFRPIYIELMGGPVLKAEVGIERKTWSLRLGVAFAKWIDEQGGQSRDDLLITVQDAIEGRYLARLQPREGRDEEAIQEQNIRLAMAAEELVSSVRRADKVLPVWELAARLVGRNLYSGPVPPDDLHMVLHKYSILRIVDDGSGYTLDRRISAGAARPQPVQSMNAGKRKQSDSGDDSDDDIDAFFLPPDFTFEESSTWVEEDNGLPNHDGFEFEDSCPDYESYLQSHRLSGNYGEPLSHSDYHLLEAELETLLGLEQEFGYLLPEQRKRVDDLAERLFIDPESLQFDDDEDIDDFGNGMPFWNN